MEFNEPSEYSPVATAPSQPSELEDLIAAALEAGTIDATLAASVRANVASGEWSLVTARAHLQRMPPEVSK